MQIYVLRSTTFLSKIFNRDVLNVFDLLIFITYIVTDLEIKFSPLGPPSIYVLCVKVLYLPLLSYDAEAND